MPNEGPMPKDVTYPVYEEMLAEFEEEKGRRATPEENSEIWRKAEEKAVEQADDYADYLRKSERESM